MCSHGQKAGEFTGQENQIPDQKLLLEFSKPKLSPWYFLHERWRSPDSQELRDPNKTHSHHSGTRMPGRLQEVSSKLRFCHCHFTFNELHRWQIQTEMKVWDSPRAVSRQWSQNFLDNEMNLTHEYYKGKPRKRCVQNVCLVACKAPSFPMGHHVIDAQMGSTCHRSLTHR